MTQILGYPTEWLVECNGFHTANEIAHQPRLWQEISQTISNKKNEIDTFLAPIFAKQDLRVILTGAGTSAFAGDAIAPYLNEKSSFVVEAIATTEIVANPEQTLNANQPTLVVSFARSGNSPESTAAVAIANQVVEDCYHLILTCNPDGELAQYASTVTNAYSLLMPEGSNDKSFAMTSSFSCMTLSALALIGHTDADFDTVNRALEAGADGIVHCYNGMRGLHHRDPGVVGAGLCHPNSYVEMIADGHHVHPTAIDVAYRCCGERLTLITDAMQAAGMPDGQYQLGEYQVNVVDGVVKTDAGGLAGSTLILKDAVFNVSKWLNMPLEKAWLRASLTPAKSLSIDHELGSLAVGKKASMVALSMTDNQVEQTWVNGVSVYSR